MLNEIPKKKLNVIKIKSNNIKKKYKKMYETFI